MKKFSKILILVCLILCFSSQNIVYSVQIDENGKEIGGYYKIYDQDSNILTEKDSVELGDIIITADFNEYEIIFIDDVNFIATAKFVKSIEKPKIRKKDIENVSEIPINKIIGLYSTHNDESYIIGDGTSSVYGAGGIHDIARALGQQLLNKKIDVIHNETLHIPHNSSAYSRSRKTASSLLQQNSTAIFDIHRDGVSRSFYLTSNNGKYYSKIRIVIGQSNPNKEANLKFALWISSVAETLYPWLIADIYFGSGKYNQDLSSKAILFEMGTHEIEKEYVQRSVPLLADVIYTTLFATTVDEASDEIIIGDTQSTKTVDDVLETYNKNSSIFPIIIFVSIIVLGTVIYFAVKRKRY